MKPEAHLKKISESRETLEECIDKGITRKQVTIGFHSSFLACNLFELYLHKANLINLSTHFKHDWLGSKRKMREKLPFDFPQKQEILDLIYLIEKNRDILCYGNPQPEEVIKDQMDRVHTLENIFKELGVNEA